MIAWTIGFLYDMFGIMWVLNTALLTTRIGFLYDLFSIKWALNTALLTTSIDRWYDAAWWQDTASAAGDYERPSQQDNDFCRDKETG